ncbi:MAG: ATP-binding protein, partial [Methanomicrobiales archaeon HGW-Methanomicrobiales-4]
MARDEEILDLIELLLAADIFNQNQNLDINDLSPTAREVFGVQSMEGERGPVVVSESALQRVLGIPDAHLRLEKHPLTVYEEFGHRLRITTLPAGFTWFVKHGGEERARKNPVLAWYGEKNELLSGISHATARDMNPRFEDSRISLDRRISRMLADDDKIRAGLDLSIISAPEEVEQTLDDIICTSDQIQRILKLKIALEHLDFLKEHRVFDIGKLLFIGPPGT